MNIENMSSEELQQHFSEKQNTETSTTTTQAPVNTAPDSKPTVSQEDLMNLNANELAAKFNGTAPKTGDEQTQSVLGDENFTSQLDELLFRKGVLSPFNNEDGSEGYVIPKTFEELAEVINANINHRVQETKGIEKQTLLDELTRESSPALRFMLDNANSFRTPEDMLPLINSVKQQDFFAQLSADTPESQEYIVRNALYLQGLDENSIEEEVKDLVERGRLEIRATQLKPILDRVSAEQTQSIIQEQESKNQQDQLFWNEYFGLMNKDLISANDIDGMQISPEHRSIIANTLVPNQELGGLPLYSLLDQHVGAGNIRLLSKIALLANDEAAFDSYYGTKKVNANAASLQKQLRTSVTSNSTSVQPSSRPVTTQSGYGNFGANK